MTGRATTVAVMLFVATSLAAALPSYAAQKSATAVATGAAKPADALMADKLPDAARLVAESDTIETGADFSWNVMFDIQNATDSGLYLDSLRCEVDDLDEGATDAPRHLSIDLSRLAKLSPTISAQSNNGIQHAGPAYAEHARLTYHLFCHRAEGKAFELVSVVHAVPGASKEYVSQFIDAGGKKIEYVIVPALGGVLKPPGVLMVHGEGSNARRMLRNARIVASRGFTVALVSMPGFGLSTGPLDLMGQASVTAASKVLDALAKSEGVDATKLAAWGISSGATVVAELATRRTDLKSIVLQSGLYDLWAVYRGTDSPELREAIVAQAGKDSTAWRERSPLLRSAKIAMPVLVVHGEKDARVPAAQAHALVAALESRRAKVESSFIERGAHVISQNEALRVSTEFLKRTLAL